MTYTRSVVAPASFPSPHTRWAARFGLFAYAAVLSASFLVPAGRAGVAGAGLLDLRTGARIENRAALLALGILLGHPQLQGIVGRVVEEHDGRRATPLALTTLRGRNDWTKHFFVSAALTVLSA